MHCVISLCVSSSVGQTTWMFWLECPQRTPRATWHTRSMPTNWWRGSIPSGHSWRPWCSRTLPAVGLRTKLILGLEFVEREVQLCVCCLWPRRCVVKTCSALLWPLSPSSGFIANISLRRQFFPDDEDERGAARALLRLQDTYRLDSELLSSGQLPGERDLATEWGIAPWCLCHKRYLLYYILLWNFVNIYPYFHGANIYFFLYGGVRFEGRSFEKFIVMLKLSTVVISI